MNTYFNVRYARFRKEESLETVYHPLVHAYHCIKHESTGFSPYLLLFGREPKLPIDAAFGMNKEVSNKASYTEYVSDLQNRTRETF